MKALFAVTALFLCSGCVTTRLTTEWADGKAAATQPKRVLITSNVADEGMRRDLEDSLTAELQRQGFSATPSHRIEPTGATVDPRDGAELASAHGFDTVLVVTRLEEGYETTYRPDTVAEHYSAGSWFTPLAGADEVHPVGRTRVEARLIDANGGGEKVIWSGTAQTYEERTQIQTAKKLARLVADALDREVGD